MDELRFIAIDEDGNKLDCSALFTFEYGGEYYIVYADEQATDKGDTLVYASAFDPGDLYYPGDGKHCYLSMSPITDESIWDFIQHILNQMQESLE